MTDFLVANGPLTETSMTTNAGLSLSDFFPLERMQALQDHFAHTHHLAVVVTDLDGHWITRPSNFSSLCEVMQRSEKVKERCELTYRTVAEALHETNAPAARECLNCGILEAGFPIQIDGVHLANCMIGQNNALRVSRQRIEEYAWLMEVDVLQVRNTFNGLPSMPLDQFSKVLDLMAVMTNEIIAQAYRGYLLDQELQRQRQMERELRQKGLDLVQASTELRQSFNRLAHDLQDMLRSASEVVDDWDVPKATASPAQRETMVASLLQQVRRAYRRVLDGMALEQSQRVEMEKELFGSQAALSLRRIRKLTEPLSPPTSSSPSNGAPDAP